MGKSERIAYVDGLRGVAIAMVLVRHAWEILWPHVPRLAPTTMLGRAFGTMSEGVELFFVLSGFCLALPVLARYERGESRWFLPSRYLARRCVRILPVYYAALAICVGCTLLAGEQRWQQVNTWDARAPLSLAGVAWHVLLLHNLTSSVFTVNSPFWSLGLEWQWYFLFPALLLLCLIRPGWSLLICLAATALWYLAARTSLPLQWYMLPSHLAEFCCGILAARAVARGAHPRTWLLGLGLCLPAADLLRGPVHGALLCVLGTVEPLYGVSFACLILLAGRLHPARAVLESTALVSLGLVSYSVYLIHYPIMHVAALLAPGLLGQPALFIGLSCALGIFGGVVLFLLVERWSVRENVRRRTEAVIAPRLFLLDALWVRCVWHGPGAATGAYSTAEIRAR